MTYLYRIHVLDIDTRKTLVRHVSMKYLIQKIFLEFMIILTRFQHNFKNEKHINVLKTQTYCMNF